MFVHLTINILQESIDDGGGGGGGGEGVDRGLTLLACFFG